MRTEPKRYLSIKKGDMVKIVAGKSRGRTGRVKEVISEDDRVIVENANMMTKVTRPTQKNPRRDFIKLEAPLHRSNVMLVCPNCKKVTRVAHEILPDGKKVRKCTHCHSAIDKA
ncbi:MAG: 50S ribosomal protein L24 [Caldisericia bacterium]|nr:50S ribosomal protein L24 [Caldisericia bacterium]